MCCFHRAVRRAFDRVVDKNPAATDDGRVTLAQCQSALNFLGYAQNLLSLDNLTEIVLSHREVHEPEAAKADKSTEMCIDFDEFCMLTSYLTILQQEIHESGCISPIKGTNLPPPPIFLTNTPGRFSLETTIVLESLKN